LDLEDPIRDDEGVTRHLGPEFAELTPERTVAFGVPAHLGRMSQAWEVHITNENDKPACISRCTVAVVDAETS